MAAPDLPPRRQRPTVANSEAFERYRRTVGSDLSRPTRIVDTGQEWSLHTQVAAHWMSRYSRRRDVLLGPPGWGDPLADATAAELLQARHLAREQARTDLPEWDDMTRRMIDMSLRNSSSSRLDVASVADPCRFGPSLRWLWAEAKGRGLSDEDAWAAIDEWARARPAAWGPDDSRRRKTPRPIAPSEQRLREVAWQRTADIDLPWRAEVDGTGWAVRLNDFPDEHMYTLLVNGSTVEDFDDWPEAWDRGDRRPTPAVPVRVGPAVVVHGRFLERYLAGEHVAVWAEMVSLGPDVRKRPHLDDARAVARETMHRARQNVDTLIQRLDALGYAFATPRRTAGATRVDHRQDPDVWLPPDSDASAQLNALEREGIVLPLSVRAWLEQVGRVDLCGAHPDLCFLDEGRGEPAVLADPLMFAPTADSVEEFVDLGQGDGLFVAFDALGKTAVGGRDQIDTAYTVEVPNASADVLLQGTAPPVTFVEHLRLSFRWGGFPGWATQSRRPEDLLTRLGEGLLPI